MKDKLRAAFGKATIHFDESMFPTEGFIGIHDEPNVRAMKLETQDKKYIIVSADLVMLSNQLIEELRLEVANITGAGFQDVWIHVTHAIATPHEPGPMGPPDKRPPETDEDRRKKGLYRNAVKEAFLEVAHQVKNTVPATMGVGSSECDANINRDKQYGDIWWTGLNPDGPSNKKMTVIRLDGEDKKPLGFFVSYGIKPCAIDNCMMQEGKRLVSTDVSGYCSEIIENKYGVPALFGVSAAADQVPKEVAWIEIMNEIGERDIFQTDVNTGLKHVEKYGSLMGETAISIAEDIVTSECNDSINKSKVSFEWQEKKGTTQIEIAAEILTIGSVAIVAEKPEINSITEKELVEASPYEHTLLLCMVNGGMKYMADYSAYERNTFEAQRSAPAKGAAEKFVELVAGELKNMV